MNPAVELRAISKRFGDVVANHQINLVVRPGTIHGIIGENGAGKSTAMKILYGLYRPDAGEILVNDRRCSWKSPADAMAAGIGMVHQHFMLAGPHTALDNIILGTEPLRSGILDRKTARARLDGLAAQYGLAVDWTRKVETLSVGVQQRIEILKLLYREATVLILDEPTAVLNPSEISMLFANLKRLRDEGKTVLLVTHKLKEVMAGTDVVTVFRNGRITGERQTKETTPQELAELMVGRNVALTIAVPPAQRQTESALQVQALTLAGERAGRHSLADLNFTVRRGEIVGIAGVEGNGQTELIDALLHPAEQDGLAGAVVLLGQNVTNWPAGRIRDLGVAAVPEDRIHEGLLPRRPLAENFLLGLHRSQRFSTWGWVNRAQLRTAAEQALENYDVRPRDLDATTEALSGGNQQKLVIAREFERNPRFIIAAQPTRGVDVGAIEFIHRRIVEARDTGAGILLISSELDEILSLSDRILVMYEGRLVAEFARGKATEQALGLKMGGS